MKLRRYLLNVVLAPVTFVVLTFSPEPGFSQGTTRTNNTTAQASQNLNDMPVPELRKLADTGNAHAQLHLGRRYELGDGLPQDMSQAAHYYRLAAEKGEAMAQNNLGYCYFRGAGVPRSEQEAIKWYRKSAEQGEPYGETNLGWMYEHGRGVPQDLNQAQVWFTKAAEKGFAQAQILLARFYRVDKSMVGGSAANYALASEWFQKAAKQGRAEAMFELGDLYYFGNLERDYPQAVRWYERAFQSGDSHAATRLGELYFDNHPGFDQDHAKSAYWFEAAAKKGDPAAQYRLAVMLMNGQGTNQNLSAADQWLQEAARNGNAEAPLKLAELRKVQGAPPPAPASLEVLQQAVYTGRNDGIIDVARALEQGAAGTPDLPTAVEGYWKVYKHILRGQEEAPARLLHLYSEGLVKPDPNNSYAPKTTQELAMWLKGLQSHVEDKPDLLFTLGRIFYDGKVVPEDWTFALDCFRASAKGGNAEAINKVGELWEAGVDGTPNSEEAARWYRRAALLGHATAQLNLGKSLQRNGEQDREESWAWLQLAAESGQTSAKQLLDNVQTRLSSEQLASAKAKLEEIRKKVTPRPAKAP